MKAIIPNLNEKLAIPLYLQLYHYIKEAIESNEIVSLEKLPSLRNLSKSLNVSITTVEQAYAQLLVEGYIFSKAQSGYYVSDLGSLIKNKGDEDIIKSTYEDFKLESPEYIYDLDCFDFNKWKKCINKVFLDYSSQLMFESNSQGEEILRYEIAKYVYSSRGVKCTPDQVVIAAGTQQITSHLARILNKMSITNVAVEEPGYLPVNNIFRDGGFVISHIPVLKNGIDIDKLPTNIPTAVYVNPSNQFPTGAVMPIGKRYNLLKWANENSSYIIEDDYDSELRYFGRPVPSLQGLDGNGRVVYLGSFSSTLFPSAKISYMVLPDSLKEIFQSTKDDYDQTCSKTEQLALAFFMEEGKYQTGIKKLRHLYSQKINAIVNILNRNAKDFIIPINTSSGINMMLYVASNKSQEQLMDEAKGIGLQILPTTSFADTSDKQSMIFYYNQIPLGEIEFVMHQLISIWKENERSH